MSDWCDKLFETYSKLVDFETELFDRINQILGDEHVEKFPCFNVEYDSYDSSIEIYLAHDTPKLTEEQARQIFDEFGFGIIFENQSLEGRGIYNRGGGFWSVKAREYDDDTSTKVVILQRQIEKMQKEINKLKNQ